jgi:PBP1b-binding outer membrane lipoprotein LpoB
MKKMHVLVGVVCAGLALSAGCGLRIGPGPTGGDPYVGTDTQPLPGCGIDSKDLRAASDRMARSIMNSPHVLRSGGVPRIVLDEKYFRNGSSQVIDKAMFTDYLRVDLQQSSNGRFVVLGRNYDDMIESERREEAAGDVTGGAVTTASKRLGWDYRLGGAIRSLTKVVPRSGARSVYFLITFELLERGSGTTIWSDRYEFKKVSDTAVIYR